MPWVAMSDDVADNAKVIRVGLLAELLWRRSIEWCNRNLTDGFIPEAKVRVLVDWHGIYEVVSDGRLMATPEPVNPLALAERLVEQGLWERGKGGFRIHHYLRHQPSAKEVRSVRRRRSNRAASAGKNGAKKRWTEKNGSETPANTASSMNGELIANRMANG